MRFKNIINSANFLFVIILYCTKRRCSQIEPQFKVELEDKREAHRPKSLVFLKIYYLSSSFGTSPSSKGLQRKNVRGYRLKPKHFRS